MAAKHRGKAAAVGHAHGVYAVSIYVVVLVYRIKNALDKADILPIARLSIRRSLPGALESLWIDDDGLVIGLSGLHACIAGVVLRGISPPTEAEENGRRLFRRIVVRNTQQVPTGLTLVLHF